MGEFASNFKSLWRRSKGRIKPSEYPGASCLDLIASVRPKIFLLVKKITEVTNTEATVFGGLGVENQVTMQIIINYLDLKRGEIWLEMLQEVMDDNIQLVDSDKQVLNIFHCIGRNKVSAVLDTQQYLIRRAKEHDEITERELYSMMKECALQDHLLAAKEVEYLARSSSYLYSVEKRLWQKAQLTHSVPHPIDAGARLHRTTCGPLNCTVWPGGTKEVQSEPDLPKDRSLPMDPTDVESSVLAAIIMKKPPVSHVPSQVSMVNMNRFTDDLAEAMQAEHAHKKRNYSLLTSRNVESMNQSYRRGSVVDLKATIRSGSASATPRSAEEGYYQVSPNLLMKVLLQLQADQSKWNWDKIIQDENAWTMRTKWRSDWYPDSVGNNYYD